METLLVRRSPDPRIKSSFAFIEANIHQRILLIDLARNSGLSAARFSHLFARSTGTTPGKYMRNLRAKLASTPAVSRRATPSLPSPRRSLIEIRTGRQKLPRVARPVRKRLHDGW
jgi:AraC-like DNA-binding protein